MLAARFCAQFVDCRMESCWDFALSFIPLFGDVEVTGLFFAGIFTPGASSEEESVSEEDDEVGSDFLFWAGLVAGFAFGAAGVDIGVLGVAFGAGGFLGASSSSLLLLLESEEETLCAFTGAAVGFLGVLTG